jgi:hypothetical protein
VKEHCANDEPTPPHQMLQLCPEDLYDTLACSLSIGIRTPRDDSFALGHLHHRGFTYHYHQQKRYRSPVLSKNRGKFPNPNRLDYCQAPINVRFSYYQEVLYSSQIPIQSSSKQIDEILFGKVIHQYMVQELLLTSSFFGQCHGLS